MFFHFLQLVEDLHSVYGTAVHSAVDGRSLVVDIGERLFVEVLFFVVEEMLKFG